MVLILLLFASQFTLTALNRTSISIELPVSREMRFFLLSSNISYSPYHCHQFTETDPINQLLLNTACYSYRIRNACSVCCLCEFVCSIWLMNFIFSLTGCISIIRNKEEKNNANIITNYSNGIKEYEWNNQIG